MARKTTSIKGEVVDFDLLEMKRTIGKKPVSADVKNREDFVYSKRKRGSKRAVQKMVKDQEPTPSSTAKVEETPAEPKETKKKITAEKPKTRKIIKKK